MFAPSAAASAAAACAGSVIRGTYGRSGGRALEIRRVAAGTRQPVELRALEESLLSGGEVRLQATPRIQGGSLQRTAVTEGHFPRQGPELVDEAQMFGSLLCSLPTGQERDAGHGRRHTVLEATHGRFGNLFRTCAFRRLHAGDDHVGREEHTLVADALCV